MKKKIMIASLLSLICVTIASLTMSLAWFDYGAKLQVGHLDITFLGEKNLLISTKPDEFKENLEGVEIGDGSPYFIPVSSMYSQKWIIKKEPLPKLKNAYKRAVIDEPSTYRETQDTKEGFFQKEIYLYTDYDIGYVSVDVKDLVLPNIELNKAKAKQLHDVNPDISEKEYIDRLNLAAKSVRLSILDPDEDSYQYFIIDPYKESDTYLCGPLAMNSGVYYDTYEKDGRRKEFVFGEYSNEDKIVYNYNTKDESFQNEDLPYSIFNAKHRLNTYAFDLEKSLANGFTPAIEDSISPLDVDTLVKIPVKKKTPKKLVVSLYLEGWDLDNTTEAMYGSFISNVKFKISEDLSNE